MSACIGSALIWANELRFIIIIIIIIIIAILV
jgi:hypothetical protein